MFELASGTRKRPKKTHRGPAHAWKRWNGLLKPQRIAILQAFKEGYVDYRIAAFASESQADAALWKLLATFPGTWGWRDQQFLELFAFLRGHLTPILESAPYSIAITKDNRSPSTIPAGKAWRLQYNKSGNAGGVVYNNLSVKANAGFDAFHTWIIENNKSGLGEAVRSFLPIPTTDILKDKLQIAFRWAFRGWFNGIATLLVLLLSVLSGRYLLSCDGCRPHRDAKQALSNPSAEDGERSTVGREDSILEHSHSVVGDSRIVMAIPPECARLPKSPERKSCLIKAADAARSNLGRARELYELAIEETYDPTSVGTHQIEDGYVNHFWKREKSGVAFLDAQTFQATAGLSSVFALHGNFSNAASIWDRAMAVVRNAVAVQEQAPPGSAFGPGVTNIEGHVKAYLDRRAGILKTGAEFEKWACGYPYGANSRCDIERGIQREADGQLLDALEDLTYGISELGDPIRDRFDLDDAAQSRYWTNILPPTETLVAETRRSTLEAIHKLKDARKALLVGGLAIWLRGSETICGAIVEFPWKPGCALEKGSTSSHAGWRLSLKFNGVAATNVASKEGRVEATLPKSTVRLAVETRLVNAIATEPRCGHGEEEIRVCRTSGEYTLRMMNESCD